MGRELDIDLIRNLAEFRRSLRSFLAASERISKAVGVTPLQYQAMLAICAWEGPMAVRHLAEQLMLTHSGAVQLVSRLEAAGLAHRVAFPEDRRVVLLSLTPAGREVLAALADEHLAEMLKREREVVGALRRLRRKAERT